MQKNIPLAGIESENKNIKTNTTKVILILGFLSALGPFSIDMYLPAFKAIAEGFNTDISQVGLSLTSYFVGISIGQIVYGPLVDRYGRKKPLLFGLTLYILSSIACSLSPSLNFLIGSRFFSALGSCVGMVASRAIVRDLFPANEVAKVFSTLILVMGVAPIVAPSMCSAILFLGWRYIFALLALISTIMLASILFFLPESRGEDKSVSLKPVNIFLEYVEIFNNKTFLIYTLAGAIAMSGLFAYIAGAPFVYMSLFNMSAKQFSIFFGMNASMFIIGSQINRFLLNKMDSKQILLLIGSFQAIGSSLLFLGNYFGFISQPITLFLISTYLFCLGFNSPNSGALSLEPFKKNAGSASALSGSIQMVISALSTAIISYFKNGTAYPMFIMMSSCAIISLLLIIMGNNIKVKIPDNE